MSKASNGPYIRLFTVQDAGRWRRKGAVCYHCEKPVGLGQKVITKLGAGGKMRLRHWLCAKEAHVV